VANFESLQARNRRRAFGLLVGMFLLVLALSVGLGSYLGLGSVSVVTVAVVVAVVSAWGSFWHSDRIVLAMTRARVVSAGEAPQLCNLVEEVCIAAGLPMPRIAVVDDPAPNAFATGRDPEHAVVAFTSGILELLDRDELQGVAAHELAHVANRDTLVMTIAATTAGVIALISDLSWRLLAFGGGRRDRNGSPLALVAVVVGAVLAPLAAMLLKSAVSRSREGLADATAVAFTRNPAGLRRALEKLAADSTVVAARSSAVAHLWIECPLDLRRSTNKLFATHPPIADRIAALRLLETGVPGRP
jgi:heat shock protein HtpX